jgi:hypothetical protein
MAATSKFVEVIGVGVLLAILLNQIFAFIRHMKNGGTQVNNQVVAALDDLKSGKVGRTGT